MEIVTINTVSIAFAVILLLVEIAWVYLSKKSKCMAVPLILWVLHALAFYLLKGQFEPKFVNSWSAGLRLHSLTTATMLEVVRLINRILTLKERGITWKKQRNST